MGWQIYENGDIAFVYGDFFWTYMINDTNRYHQGGGATIGLEAIGQAASSDAIQYHHSSPTLQSRQSFLFQKL